MSDLALNQEAVRQVLTDPATMATTIVVILESLFTPAELYGSSGVDAVDPVAVITHLEASMGLDIPAAVENRIQAVLLLRTTQAFEEDLTAFVAVALALYDGYMGDMASGVMEDLDVSEALWAVFEAACVDPGMQVLSPQVENYILALTEEPVDGDSAVEDEVADVTRRMSVLQDQLLTIGVPASVIDTVFSRGMAALNHAEE